MSFQLLFLFFYMRIKTSGCFLSSYCKSTNPRLPCNSANYEDADPLVCRVRLQSLNFKTIFFSSCPRAVLSETSPRTSGEIHSSPSCLEITVSLHPVGRRPRFSVRSSSFSSDPPSSDAFYVLLKQIHNQLSLFWRLVSPSINNSGFFSLVLSSLMNGPGEPTVRRNRGSPPPPLSLSVPAGAFCLRLNTIWSS